VFTFLDRGILELDPDFLYREILAVPARIRFQSFKPDWPWFFV